MKIELREIYKCEYCNKLYQIKGYCIKHEKICTKNPINDRICFGCKYLSIKMEYIADDNSYMGDNERSVDLFHCDKKDTFLYPPKVEHKKNYFETSKGNNPMPITCEDHLDEYEHENFLKI